MNIEGKILVINDAVKVSGRFTKREFVVEYAKNPQYPEMIMFQMVQDRCAQLDGFNVGDHVNVHFDLRGREWRSPKGEVKYFNTLQAWRVDIMQGAPTSPVEPAPDGFSNDPSDGIPF